MNNESLRKDYVIFSIRHRKLGSSSFEIENKVSTFLADLRDFKIQREII